MVLDTDFDEISWIKRRRGKTMRQKVSWIFSCSMGNECRWFIVYVFLLVSWVVLIGGFKRNKEFYSESIFDLQQIIWKILFVVRIGRSISIRRFNLYYDLLESSHTNV